MTNDFLTPPEALVRLREARVVPVIVIDDPGDAVPLARALKDGGLACVEVTFRTPRAAEALRRIAAEVPDVLAGAGTVLFGSYLSPDPSHHVPSMTTKKRSLGWK